MVEFLIPFLLISRFPVNDPNIYYGPQYVFNLSHTWVREFDNSTGHGHLVATMKCQNSSVTRLICQLINPSQRRYIEDLNGVTDPKEPKYEVLDCEGTRLCDSFEISFNKYGLKELIVSRDLDSFALGFLRPFVRLFNVSWIDIEESDDGLIKAKDQSLYGKCDVVIKITKEKLKSDNAENLFEIDSVKGFHGMTYNYKKTRDVERCSNGGWIAPIDESFLRYTLKSSVVRVIVSAHQFLSLIEDETSFILPDGMKVTNFDKTTVTLHSVEPVRNQLSAVVDPVYKNLSY